MKKVTKEGNIVTIHEPITVKGLAEAFGCTYQNASYIAKKYLKYITNGNELVITVQTTRINRRPAPLPPALFDINGMNITINSDVRLIQLMKALKVSFQTITKLIARNEIETYKKGRNVYLPPCVLQITPRIKKKMTA